MSRRDILLNDQGSV